MVLARYCKIEFTMNGVPFAVFYDSQTDRMSATSIVPGANLELNLLDRVKPFVNMLHSLGVDTFEFSHSLTPPVPPVG